MVSVRKYPPLGLGSGGYVTGKQLEQDVERIVEHYQRLGFLEAKAHAEAATSPAALGQLGAVAAGADTVSRDAKTIFVRYTIEEGPRLVLGSEDFRTDEGRAPPLRASSSCSRASPPGPATPTRPRRSATTAGAWNGCWATRATRPPASTPTSTATAIASA